MQKTNQKVRLMRLLLLLALAIAGLAPAAETYTHGQFALAWTPGQAALPSSIQWQPHQLELLAPKAGLNLSFTSFEFHSKYYREESAQVWQGQQDPRFVTDVLGAATVVEVAADGFAGLAASYTSSYALVTRQLLFHDREARLRIVYTLHPTREIVVHEADNLAAHLQLGPAFTGLSRIDIRAADGPLLTRTGPQPVAAAASVLLAGPSLAVGQDGKLGALLLPGCDGDVPAPPPVRLLTLKQGTTLTLTLDVLLASGDLAPLQQELRRLAAAQPAWQRPFALVEVARLLDAQNLPQEAEAALLEAARLNDQYAVPFALLAALRRDRKLPGESTAWVEGGWRNPYNYGYSLSATGYGATAGLTEAQRRLHTFNLLIAVENCQFYPDYYVWAARDFEARHMYAQACAMYRQGLWAIDHMPRADAFKEKTRQRFQAKLAELEQKLLTQSATDLPEQLPLRLPTTP
jgi:hypothetical protein